MACILDPLTYTLAVILLGAVGLIASYVPTRRALAVDPVTALRYD